MSLFGRAPDAAPPEFDPIEIQDPFRRRYTVQDRWRHGAAHWRATYIAREVFGDEARVTPSSISPRGGIDGFLDIEVPIVDFQEYRRREAIFLSWVGSDPLLAEAGYLYLMGPLRR